VELEHVPDARARQEDAAGEESPDESNGPMPVEERDPDGEAHPERVDRACAFEH